MEIETWKKSVLFSIIKSLYYFSIINFLHFFILSLEIVNFSIFKGFPLLAIN